MKGGLPGRLFIILELDSPVKGWLFPASKAQRCQNIIKIDKIKNRTITKISLVHTAVIRT